MKTNENIKTYPSRPASSPPLPPNDVKFFFLNFSAIAR